MVYITGDLHGDIDRFYNPEIKKLKKGDTLIICGDFGFIWDNSKKETDRLKWIGNRRYNVLFVEGCHDNYNLLKEYNVAEWNKGKVREITGNLKQLLRGEVFEIEGRKYFTFGGGEDEDYDEIYENAQYDDGARPTDADVQNAIKNLEANDCEVDYIITHDAPGTVSGAIDLDASKMSSINVFFGKICEECKFKMWYFGKYHIDKIFPPRYTAVFQAVKTVEQTPLKNKKK